MKIGALIVTTGLSRISGVAALLPEVGAISAGQRMISAFQCGEVSLVGLVVGPEDKKPERQLSQGGVVFLRCEKDATFFDGVLEGLRFMVGKFDRVFIVPGDMPLFLPDTLRSLLHSTAHIAIPITSHVNGCPVLLDHAAMKAILEDTESTSLENALSACPLEKAFVPVSDSGTLLRGEDMSHRKEMIRLQDQQLTRPMLDVTLRNGTSLYDPKLSMLLHLVEQTGSVRDACSLMQISYSTAWNMLNHIEDELGYPLVIRIRGGAVGSGSVLTEKGRELMTAYDRFTENLQKTAKTLYDDFFGDLAELNSKK